MYLCKVDMLNYSQHWSNYFFTTGDGNLILSDPLIVKFIGASNV